MSQKVADSQGRKAFKLSHARLVQIENDESTPGIYKLFTLSIVYGVPLESLMSHYMDLSTAHSYHIMAEHAQTRPLDFEPRDAKETIEVPMQLNHAASLERTAPLSEIVKQWGHVPLGALQHMNVRRGRYAIIGRSDYTMYPLLRPGSFVQLEECHSPGRARTYANELERPLYLIDTRSGYVCSWCEVRRNRLVSVPHPLSPCHTREFAYPDEAQIVGRVVAIAARLCGHGDTPKSRAVSDVSGDECVSAAGSPNASNTQTLAGARGAAAPCRSTRESPRAGTLAPSLYDETET